MKLTFQQHYLKNANTHVHVYARAHTLTHNHHKCVTLLYAMYSFMLFSEGLNTPQAFILVYTHNSIMNYTNHTILSMCGIGNQGPMRQPLKKIAEK